MATYDNGRCPPPIPGCMNTAAANYQAIATYDPNKACIFAYPGCMSSTAFNYNPTANVNSGCVPRIPGCTDSRASNYQPGFNTPGPPSCVFLGCINSLDTRYSSIATISDGSCPNAPGCTNPAAANYNAVYNVLLAGSCTYGGCMTVGNTNYNARNTFAIPGSCAGSGRRLEEDAPGRRLQGPGCLDPTATMYSASATSHVQSMCTYAILGCTDPNAFNYMPAATAGNARASSACIARVTGCMSPTALNYNSNANTAGTCTYAVNGCMDSAATTFMAAATVNVQSLCAYNIPGCTTPGARNFNSSANVNVPSSCQYNVTGCTDPTATNYVAGANIAAACTYPGVSGCMSPAAVNFNPSATVDYGSCVVYSPPPRPPPPFRPPRPPRPPLPPRAPLPVELVGGTQFGSDNSAASIPMLVPVLLSSAGSIVLIGALCVAYVVQQRRSVAAAKQMPESQAGAPERLEMPTPSPRLGERTIERIRRGHPAAYENPPAQEGVIGTSPSTSHTRFGLPGYPSAKEVAGIEPYSSRAVKPALDVSSQRGAQPSPRSTPRFSKVGSTLVDCLSSAGTQGVKHEPSFPPPMTRVRTVADVHPRRCTLPLHQAAVAAAAQRAAQERVQAKRRLEDFNMRSARPERNTDDETPVTTSHPQPSRRHAISGRSKSVALYKPICDAISEISYLTDDIPATINIIYISVHEMPSSRMVTFTMRTHGPTSRLEGLMASFRASEQVGRMALPDGGLLFLVGMDKDLIFTRTMPHSPPPPPIRLVLPDPPAQHVQTIPRTKSTDPPLRHAELRQSAPTPVRITLRKAPDPEVGMQIQPRQPALTPARMLSRKAPDSEVGLQVQPSGASSYEGPYYVEDLLIWPDLASAVKGNRPDEWLDLVRPVNSPTHVQPPVEVASPSPRLTPRSAVAGTVLRDVPERGLCSLVPMRNPKGREMRI